MCILFYRHKLLLLLYIFIFSCLSFENLLAKTADRALTLLQIKPDPGTFTLWGTWTPIFNDSGPELIRFADYDTYFVYRDNPSSAEPVKSIGGLLNLKYHSGISYDYLRENLPGEKISLDVFVPENAVGNAHSRPNTLRAGLKSETGGEFTEYYGVTDGINITKSGIYEISLDIPKNSFKSGSGRTFHPSDTAIFTIEELFPLNQDGKIPASFSFSFFRISDIRIDGQDLKWEFLENGYSQPGKYLPRFEQGSSFLYSLSESTYLKYVIDSEHYSGFCGFPYGIGELFISLQVYLPVELRQTRGSVTLAMSHRSLGSLSCVKNFSTSDTQGRVYLTLAPGPSIAEKDFWELVKEAEITIKIITSSDHELYMMPLVIEPIYVRQGYLIPFDNNWKMRDANHPDAHEEPLLASAKSDYTEIKAKAQSDDLYQMDITISLKGGISRDNPLYKVELVRNFDLLPSDMDNMHLEILISPLTDTTDVRQAPYRARIGLIDLTGKIMLGPNVSLSEGKPVKAVLDVSLVNPMPKGLVMEGFDPHKVKSVLINLEASHEPADNPKVLQLSFLDLSVRRVEYPRNTATEEISFSDFTRNPDEWQIASMIRNNAGYVVGINYPFPVADIPPGIMEIPQIYSFYGQNTSPAYLDIDSDIAREIILRDFKNMVSNNINITRLLIFGDLDGVYTWRDIFMWSVKMQDIYGFGNGIEAIIEEAAGMDVGRFTDFLNNNDDNIFLRDNEGNFLGLKKHVMANLTALLDILEQVEKDTGKRLTAILSLYDSLLADGIRAEEPFIEYGTAEHTEIITDPVIKTKALALLWKVMKTLREDPRFEKYIALVEIMNEPANATALSTRESFADLYRFVGDGLYILKDALGPFVPVSVGFRSWPSDLRYWHGLENGIDILIPHYWENLESYDIDRTGMWPIDMPVEKLWQYLGAKADGRFTGIGEISPGKGLKNNLYRMEKAGYDIAIVCSYPEHYSFVTNPYLPDISDYEAGNKKFGEFAANTGETTLKNAFSFIRTFLENAGDGSNTIPKLRSAAGAMADSATQKAVFTVIDIAQLKDITLNPDNINYLEKKAMKYSHKAAAHSLKTSL